MDNYIKEEIVKKEIEKAKKEIEDIKKNEDVSIEKANINKPEIIGG